MLSVRAHVQAFIVVWAVLGYDLQGKIANPLICLGLLAPILSAGIVFYGGLLWQIFYYHFLHPLSKFPGPFLAGVTRLWLAHINFEGREHVKLLELHRLHGPIVRISPTLLSVSEASMLPLIYHRDADKTEHYSSFVKGGPQSFFNIMDHKSYVKARKVVGKPFTPSGVKDFEPLVDTHIKTCISQLQSISHSSQPFNFAPIPTFLAYDILTDLAFGHPLGFISTLSDTGNLIKGLHTGWLFFGLLSRLHPLKSFLASSTLTRRLTRLKPSGTPKSGFGILMQARDRIIEERLELMNSGGGKELRRDVLQGLLEAVKEGTMDMETVRQEILVLLIAGADTVSTSLQTIMLDLLRHPKAMNRCVQEILTAERQGIMGELPSQRQVNEHCPYLMACVKETLRVNPGGPSIFPRLVGSEGVVLGGVFVPPGTEVAANIWVLARDEKLYGADAAEWKPERWLTGDESKIREMNRLSLTWGMDRACLGKELALMELCKIIPELLRRFEWQLLEEGQKQPRFVVKSGVGWWEDVWVDIKERINTSG